MANTFTLEDVCNVDLSSIPYNKFIEKLEKALDTPLHISTKLTLGDIARSNGREDALKCLEVLPPRVQIMTIMPAVKRTAELTEDSSVHGTIATINRWHAGDKTIDLKAACHDAIPMGNSGNIGLWAAYWALLAAGVAYTFDNSCDHTAGTAAKAASEVAYAARSSTDAAVLAAAMGAGQSMEIMSPAYHAERELQLADIIEMHPPIQWKTA